MPFQGKVALADRDPRLPPGQYDVEDRWPVLHIGTEPTVDAGTWSLTLDGAVREPTTWTLAELQGMPPAQYEGPLHCVTRWTKFGLRFTGVSLDTLLAAVAPDPDATHVRARATTGYTTSLTVPEVTNGRAWVVYAVDDQPLPTAHGGPLRLLVPDRYLWKSAKWITGLSLSTASEPGFWESHGYHHRGDPWTEERYEDGPRW